MERLLSAKKLQTFFHLCFRIALKHSSILQVINSRLRLVKKAAWGL